MDISGNDIHDPATEEPGTPAGSGGGEGSEGNEGNTGTPDAPAGDTGTGSGTTAPDTPDGDTGDGSTATPPDSPHQDTAAEESARELVEALDAVAGKLDACPDGSGIAESFSSLADAVERQTELLQAYAVHSVPLSGYRDYSYPVHVVYRIYPTALGSETKVSNDYGTPEEFGDGYSYMTDSVAAGNLAWFSIFTVTDAEGTDVYEEYAAPEEPEDPADPQEPEEPDTFREDVLSALDALGGSLDTISANDIAYHGQSLETLGQTLAVQEELLDLQRESVQLGYGILAGTLVLSFTLLFTLGYMVAHGFLQRMKVG